MTRRKNPWRFVLLLPLAAAILSAVFSSAEGWRRYVALIGMGGGAIIWTFWFLVAQNWWNDWRVLPRMKAEFTIVLDSLTELVKTDPHARRAGSEGIGGISWIHAPDGAKVMLTVFEEKGRCHVDYVTYNDGQKRRVECYPGGLEGTVRLEPWLQEALERLYAAIAENQTARDRRLEDIVTALRRYKPPS